jgi:ATP-dependent DNA helicase DinG
MFEETAEKERAKVTVFASPSVADVFQKILPSYGFEVREGQEFMAYHIETAIKKRNILLAEAGVGTGKTFAYLIPALLAFDWTATVLRNTLVIATNTIVLQHQLIKDISRLTELLGIKINPEEVVLAKGKNNFLCPKRSSEALESLAKQGYDVDELAKWAALTQTGDRNEAPPCSDEVWQSICVPEFSNCSRCAEKNYCCYQNQRRKWLGARIIVTNHQQLLADALNREENLRALLFKGTDMIIIDEAHRFEEAATQMLGTAFTFNDIKKMPELIKGLEQHLMYHIKESDIVESLGEELIHNLKNATQWDSQEENGRAFIKITDALADSIRSYLVILNRVSELGALAATTRYESHEFTSRTERLLNTLDALLTPKSHVFWAEMEGFKIKSINAIPRNMSKRLNDLLWSRRCPIILTSATLTGKDAGDYTYWINSLGLSEAKTMRAVPSPFDFQENRIVYIPPLETIPNHHSKHFLDFASKEAAGLIKITEGRTLLLFTSHKDLRYVSGALQRLLPEYNFLVQGQEQDAQLVEKFKQLPHAVLLGTAYWEGLDVPGSALISVICIKLPFSPPDPVLEAKAEDNKKKGLDPFTSVYLANMLIKLKQGIGRLIRTNKDYGVLAILDKRAHLGQKSYSQLLHSLLDPSEVTSSLQRVEEFIAAKKLLEHKFSKRTCERTTTKTAAKK